MHCLRRAIMPYLVLLMLIQQHATFQRQPYADDAAMTFDIYMPAVFRCLMPHATSDVCRHALLPRANVADATLLHDFHDVAACCCHMRRCCVMLIRRFFDVRFRLIFRRRSRHADAASAASSAAAFSVFRCARLPCVMLPLIARRHASYAAARVHSATRFTAR